MRKLVTMLMTIAFVFSIAVIAARAAPPEKAFASNAVAEVVSPVVVAAPVMIGYDVIQNISTQTRDQLIAQNTFGVDTSAKRRLSSTVGWRSINADGYGSTITRPEPRRVLLA